MPLCAGIAASQSMFGGRIFCVVFPEGASHFDRWRSALIVSFLRPRFARRVALGVAFSRVSGVA